MNTIHPNVRKLIFQVALFSIVTLFFTLSANATSTYSEGTITLTDGTTNLSTLYLNINNSNVLSRLGNEYILTANIIINPSARLIIDGETLKFNGVYVIRNHGNLIINNSIITSVDPTKRGFIKSHKKPYQTTGYIFNLTNSNISYLGRSELDIDNNWIWAVQTWNGARETPIISNNEFFNNYCTLSANGGGDIVTNNTFHDSEGNGIVDVSSNNVFDNNILYNNIIPRYLVITWGNSKITNNYAHHNYIRDGGAGFYQKEGLGGAIISGNKFESNTGDGTRIAIIGSNHNQWTYIENNIIDDGYGYGITIQGNGYLGGYDVYAIIRNNTINGGAFGIKYPGVGFFGGNAPKYVKVYNNIISNTGNGIDVEGNLHYNSTIFDNTITGSYVADIKFGHFYVAGNVTPKFINNKYSTTSIWSGVFYNYKYLDVKVVDGSNNPISGATVNITNSIDNSCPSINMNGENKTSLITGTDGHIPLPIGNKSNSAAVLDFWKTNDKETHMSYTIDAFYKGHTALVPDVNPNSNWYRSNPNTYNNTIVIILPFIIDSNSSAPVLAPIGDRSVNAGSLLQFTISATDPHNDPLTYSATGLPTGASLDGTSGVFTWTPSDGQAGTHVVTFMVSDGSLTDSEAVTITVNEINHAPVLASIGARSVDEESTLTFTVSATDADGDSLTYSATGLPTGASMDAISGAFTWTPSDGQAGTHVVTFMVSDGSLTESEAVTITVNEINHAPVLASIGARYVDEGSTLTFTVSATDADGDSLTYSASGLPTGASMDAISGVFTWTPLDGQAGTHVVTFMVSDGFLTDSEAVTITVNEINHAPVLASIGARSVDEESTLTFMLSATDADGDSLTYSASGLPTGASMDATSGVFTWTPSDGQAGTHVVTFVVSDSSLTDSEAVTITVNEAIEQPALTVIDNRLRESTPDSVLGGTTWIDVGRIDSIGNYRGTIRFDLSQFNSTDHIEQATFSLFWYYESRNQSTDVGIYRPANWDTDYVTWNTRTNGVAWNNPGGDWYDRNNAAQGAESYAAVTFPVDTPPDYMYHDFDVTELVQSYVNGTYENTGFFIKANEIDNSYIAFYSSDWSNASQQPKLTITHTPEGEPVNHAPALNSIGDRSVSEGSPLQFTISATDPDSDPLTYSATNLPTGATFNPTTRTFSWTPGETQAGEYTVHFEVTDGSLIDAEDVTITVTEETADLPPTASAGPDHTAYTGESLTFDASSSSDDHGITSYVWDFDASDGLQQDAAGAVVTHTYDTAGTYTVTLTVTDTGGNTGSDTAVVTVNDMSTLPVITGVTTTSITSSSATVIWNTDKASDSLVRYGTVSGVYTAEAYNAADVVSHSIQLTGLSPDTTYYYVVNSTDPYGNSNESVEYDFTTGSQDTAPTVVTDPTASPAIIPDDTDNDPQWGESSRLNVTVTDDDGIENVTINLSSIGGSPAQPMTHIGDNIWSVTTNASGGTAGFNGTAYTPHFLQVTATDIHGNSNTSAGISLTVVRNGDVNSDGEVDYFGDVVHLIRYLGDAKGFDVTEGIADVTGDGVVNDSDVTYLTNHTHCASGYEILH